MGRGIVIATTRNPSSMFSWNLVEYFEPVMNVLVAKFWDLANQPSGCSSQWSPPLHFVTFPTTSARSASITCQIIITTVLPARYSPQSPSSWCILIVRSIQFCMPWCPKASATVSFKSLDFQGIKEELVQPWVCEEWIWTTGTALLHDSNWTGIKLEEPGLELLCFDIKHPVSETRPAALDLVYRLYITDRFLYKLVVVSSASIWDPAFDPLYDRGRYGNVRTELVMLIMGIASESHSL